MSQVSFLFLGFLLFALEKTLDQLYQVFVCLFSDIGVGAFVNSLEISFELLEVEDYGIWTDHFFSKNFFGEFFCCHRTICFFEDSDQDISYTSSLVSSFFESVSSES